MRFGILGAGRIAKIHAANVAERKDCEVRLVADIDAAAHRAATTTHRVTATAASMTATTMALRGESHAS